jgi:hypothetical protein
MITARCFQAVTRPRLRTRAALVGFWSWWPALGSGLSQTNLRVLPPSPPKPADLLLPLADPPDVRVSGVSLRDLLAPACARLADPEADEASEK